jgi:hypothetical protein
MSISGVLQRITTALDHNNVAYMLTRSFASAYYGTPRSTQDIDVVVEALTAHLRGHFPMMRLIRTWIALYKHGGISLRIEVQRRQRKDQKRSEPPRNHAS